MIAQFPGFCVECDYSINEGDEIAKRDGAWAHVECPLVTTYTELCQTCFIFKAIDGSCLCE